MNEGTILKTNKTCMNVLTKPRKTLTPVFKKDDVTHNGDNPFTASWSVKLHVRTSYLKKQDSIRTIEHKTLITKRRVNLTK